KTALLAALLLGAAHAPALAQSVTVDLGKTAGGTATARMLQLIALGTVISLAPSILVMMTSFTRIIIVLSFVRSAIGVQTTPPNQVLTSLALFLTLFIMQPVFEKAYEDGIRPLMDEEITEVQAFERTSAPFHAFMLQHVRADDLKLFANMAKDVKIQAPEDTPWRVLIPAYMISELKRAFEIGFLIYVPFIIIDMLIASILMAMGMMMLPPVTISLPFKVIFFVLVDGWSLVCGSLVRSFG
ncbi:MAG: flagellar type III secretion system pore protein FliP, partial [Alphaproteobacteria bacterium]|nr:flagellar type III secretion system pore protein FliP [Alphaproteobacteria bacterium]